MARALQFYSETLQLDVTMRGEDWSTVDAGGVMIGLNARETATGNSGGGAVISFQPEDGDIDSEVERLRSAGVEFTGGISEHSWGRIAPFRDPEGNDLQFYAPPS
jgi:predicted enzyme related to lactoylglutathione lyase